jgi:hypothetical protein
VVAAPGSVRGVEVRFYLGTNAPNWLWRPDFADVPLFLSHRVLRKRSTPYPPALTRYGVDSGAFTELSKHGRWMETPEEYVAGLRRYWQELGPFDFAAQQDHVCLSDVLDIIGHLTGVRPTVVDQLEATVANFLRLREIAPDLRIAPTIQGRLFEDFLLCADMFEEAGVDLAAEPIVGVGSLVGKSPREVERIATALQARGITRLHGYGVKSKGVDAASHRFASMDSSVWSYWGRMDPLPNCSHKQCQNCPEYALQWLEQILDRSEGPQQMAFAI